MEIDPARIRRLRESRAWSQEQLAEVAGLSVRTVQRVERGAGASLETRMALASALDVEPAALCLPPASGAGGVPAAGAADQVSAVGAAGRKADGGERNFRATVIAVGIAIVFALFLLFGYMMGRDLALKEERRECIAEGRTDCR